MRAAVGAVWILLALAWGGAPFAGLPRGENPRLLGLAADTGGRMLVADYDYGAFMRFRTAGSGGSY